MQTRGEEANREQDNRLHIIQSLYHLHISLHYPQMELIQVFLDL